MLKLVLIMYDMVDHSNKSYNVFRLVRFRFYRGSDNSKREKVIYISIFVNLCWQVLYYDQPDLTGLPSLKNKRYYQKLCALYNILKTSLTLLKIHLFRNLVEMAFSVLLTLPAVCKNKSI